MRSEKVIEFFIREGAQATGRRRRRSRWKEDRSKAHRQTYSIHHDMKNLNSQISSVFGCLDYFK
jgi:hypothetical protein